MDLLEGVASEVIATSRLETHLLTSGPEDGVPVLLIHGNATSSRFFEETLAALPSRYRGLAPDLRGFGGSETKLLDATRGWGTSPTTCARWSRRWGWTESVSSGGLQAVRPPCGTPWITPTVSLRSYSLTP